MEHFKQSLLFLQYLLYINLTLCDFSLALFLFQHAVHHYKSIFVLYQTTESNKEGHNSERSSLEVCNIMI